jgi:hypothetical protein
MNRLTGDLWAVTSYYNPLKYYTKLSNYLRFADLIRTQGLKLMVVEAAQHDSAFEVPAATADCLLQLRTAAVLWHKERLLNIGINNLPRKCDRVVWLDADILFDDSQWIQETATLLQEYVSIQPYSTAWRLGPGETTQREATAASRAVLHVGAVHALRAGITKRYMPGHPGFAWAARREFIARHGLYEKCILGGGDMTAALAMCMPHSSAPFCSWLDDTTSPLLRNDIVQWSARVYDELGGRVGHLDATVRHLWHGSRENRQYRARAHILIQHEFDPGRDIVRTANGCWEWTKINPALAEAVGQYFFSRREDDESEQPQP